MVSNGEGNGVITCFGVTVAWILFSGVVTIAEIPIPAIGVGTAGGISGELYGFAGVAFIGAICIGFDVFCFVADVVDAIVRRT